MNAMFFWLADANPADVMAKSRSWSDPAKREVLVFLCAVGLVVLAILIWAVFLRKPGGRRRRHHHHRHDATRAGVSAVGEATEPHDEEVEDDEADEEAGRKGGRRRRRRRQHRPRNPTLAETGGLPPPREPRPPASPPS